MAENEAARGRAEVFEDLQQLGRKRLLDRAAAELFQAFAAVGVQTVLLKGPATARVLYVGERRFYSDVDLLVSPSDFERACQVAVSLGFLSPSNPSGAFARWLELRLEGQERTLTRPTDQVSLDLHRTFHLLPPAAQLMPVLWPRHDELLLNGVAVTVPDAASVGLLVLLHAKTAGHRASPHQRLSADVTRVVERLPADTWPALATMARALGVERSVVAVLRERGGSPGAQLARSHFPGIKPDRWLTAHLRTGSISAFQVCKLRQYPWGTRVLWCLLPFVPWLRPHASMAHQAAGAAQPTKRTWLVRDVWDMLRIATRP